MRRVDVVAGLIDDMALCPISVDGDGEDHRQTHLEEYLLPHLQPVAGTGSGGIPQPHPVVHRPQSAQPHQRQNPRKNVVVGDIGEQEGGGQDGNDDHDFHQGEPIRLVDHSLQGNLCLEGLLFLIFVCGAGS